MKKRILIYNCDFDKGRNNTALAIKRILVRLNGIDVAILSPHKGEFANRLKIYDGFILTGSRANVVDKEKWIKRLSKDIREISKMEKLLLGVCFGHQIIAQALGGKVEKTREKEFGYAEAKLTRDGKESHLFSGVHENFPTFASHVYSVTRLPRGAKILARNRHSIQAFSLGKTLGVQFHPEIDYNMALALAKKRGEKLLATAELIKREGEINEGILSNFGRMIKES